MYVIYICIHIYQICQADKLYIYIYIEGFLFTYNTVGSLCLCYMECLIPFNFVQQKKKSATHI